MITVKPKQKARKWVKERLKRHTGSWIIIESETNVSCWPGEISIRIKNTNDNWTGWFPITDIETTNNDSKSGTVEGDGR